MSGLPSFVVKQALRGRQHSCLDCQSIEPEVVAAVHESKSYCSEGRAFCFEEEEFVLQENKYLPQETKSSSFESFDTKWQQQPTLLTTVLK